MLLTISGVHPRPGVVADADIAEQDSQPGEMLDAVNAAAAPVAADGPLNLPATRPGCSQLRIAVRLSFAEIDQVLQSAQGMNGRSRNQVCHTGGALQRPRKRLPIGLRG
jgi:hypothetical protein